MTFEAEVQGVGKLRESVAGGGTCEASFLARVAEWEDNLEGKCNREVRFFSSSPLLFLSLDDQDLGSPSQTSISMHRHPRRST